MNYDNRFRIQRYIHNVSHYNSLPKKCRVLLSFPLPLLLGRLFRFLLIQSANIMGEFQVYGRVETVDLFASSSSSNSGNICYEEVKSMCGARHTDGSRCARQAKRWRRKTIDTDEEVIVSKHGKIYVKQNSIKYRLNQRHSVSLFVFLLSYWRIECYRIVESIKFTVCVRSCLCCSTRCPSMFRICPLYDSLGASFPRSAFN